MVDETPPAVDLDNRDPFAVLRLERAISVDRYLAQLEPELVVGGGYHPAGRRTEMAPRRGEEDDLGYG